MFGSGVIDVAIGLVFVFLLLSLIVTTLNEFIAAFLSARAKFLRKGIEQLLGATWATKLYDHPLIAGTYIDPKGPSYIASRSFSTALLHIASESDHGLANARRMLDEGAGQMASNATAEEVKAAMSSLRDRIAALGGAAKAVAIDIESHVQKIGRGGYSVGDAVCDIRALVDSNAGRYIGAVIAGVGDENLRRALTALYQDANRDFARFKENLEIWFNNAMDRVGGWYKKKSLWVIGGLAVAVTLVLNVDALLVMQHLNTQSALREAIVAQAKAFTEPGAGGSMGNESGGASTSSPAGSPADVIARARAVEGQLSKLGLPIGWFVEARTSDQEVSRFRRDNLLVLPSSGDAFVETVRFHGVGWLLTALAASLGAPFWFDVLNRFMSIRAAGKAPEEKPKAPKEVPTPLEPGQSPVEADRASGQQR